MSRPRHPGLPRATAAGLLVVLALGATACGESGGSDVAPGGGADAAGSSSSSPSASSAPSATATTRTKTGLEAQAPVRAARSWAAAVAAEVNSKSDAHVQTRPFTTRRGARTLPRLYREYYGLSFPGPLPFTPLSVQVSGSTARVPACIQSQGWGLGDDNVAPQSTQLTASSFVLKQVRGTWKLDTITGRQESCADVTVKGSTR